jgi:hypothetical protein
MRPEIELRAVLRVWDKIRRRLFSDPGLRADVKQLRKELRAVNRTQARLLRHTLRSREGFEALLRHAYVDPESLAYPQRLLARRFGVLSQNSEDGVVLALVQEAGVTTRTFVEIGCGDNGGDSGFLARELGWSGVMIDGSQEALDQVRLRFNERRVRIVEAFVTRENVDELLRGAGIDGEVDFLSIDIDGNDIWVWEALESCSPRVVCVEFNAIFGPTRAVAVPYDANWTYEAGSDYYGASLAAFARLGRRKGYRLVAVEPRGVNAFFVRDDLAPHVPEAEPEDAFFPLLTPAALYDEIGGGKARRLLDRERDLDEAIAARGLALVDVE